MFSFHYHPLLDIWIITLLYYARPGKKITGLFIVVFARSAATKQSQGIEPYARLFCAYNRVQID